MGKKLSIFLPFLYELYIVDDSKFIIEFQIRNTKETIKLGEVHFSIFNKWIDLGSGHQWMQNPLNKRWTGKFSNRGIQITPPESTDQFQDCLKCDHQTLCTLWHDVIRSTHLWRFLALSIQPESNQT